MIQNVFKLMCVHFLVVPKMHEILVVNLSCPTQSSSQSSKLNIPYIKHNPLVLILVFDFSTYPVPTSNLMQKDPSFLSNAFHNHGRTTRTNKADPWLQREA